MPHIKALYDCIRHACSIELKDIVILTGGSSYGEIESYKVWSRVTVYNNKGFVADWPELNYARQDHGCGHYVNTDTKVVRHIENMVFSKYIFVCKSRKAHQ